MKGKKLLSGILSAAMVLSTAALPIFAEEGSSTVDYDWYTSSTNTYTLNDAGDLLGFAKIVNGTADIADNFSGKTVTLGADVDLDGIDWTPIGKEGKSFKGTFDGNGKTVKNLKSVHHNMQSVGFFGFTQEGEIKNFTIENATIDGYLCVGVVAGTPYTSKYKDITVKGDIKVDGYAYVGGALGKNAYADVDNVDVKGNAGSYVKADSDVYATYVGGLIGFVGEGNHTISNCDVEIDVSGSVCYVGGLLGILHYGNVLKDCTYKGSLKLNPDNDVLDEGDDKFIGALTGVTHSGLSKDENTGVYSQVSGGTNRIEGCTAEVTEATVSGTEATQTITAFGEPYDHLDPAASDCKNSAPVYYEAVLNNVPVTKVNNCEAMIVKANGKEVYYRNLKDALDAATSDETIKIYSDVTYSKHVSGANRVTNAKALDLNGKTLSLPDDDYNFGAITISNGTIESTKTTMSETTALIFQYDQDPITFDGVTINTKDFSTYGYVIGTNGGKCVFKNSKMNVNPTAQKEIASLFSPGDHTSNSNLVIEDSEINVSNASTKIALWGNVEIKGSTKINADLTDNDGIRLNNYGSLKVTATTDAEGNTKAPEINITTTGSNRYGINVADTTPYTVAPEAKVNTSVYRAPSASNIANDEIKLSFEDVTVNEGEKVYDLYVEAASNKTINRLTTADLTFALTNDSANKTPISYEVFGTDKVTVQPDNASSNKFMFYFNGLTAPSGTGVKVKVGQIKFNGYGKFGFKATAGEAHATTVDGENVVTDFVAGTQHAGQGKLNIDAKLDNVEIKAPTRKLTVKIDFNNSVSAQSAEYTDMTVKVSGLGESYEEKLGNIIDNKAEVEFVDVLEKNKTYMVEVSGAGYRTARYTVTMTEDKTLNFWNNAKDSAVNVEEGNSASAKNVTFLAGELVKDGQINIYDLSAVVSYFGTVNDVTGESQYAKYDLNRDGKVDSKDVAYVLVSWGK